MGSEVKVILSGWVAQSRISSVVSYWTDRVLDSDNDGCILFRMEKKIKNDVYRTSL